MFLEDYPYNPSEYHRVARLTECMKMDLEDESSKMNELHWRRLRSEQLLKEKIRAEVEQRKNDEILEKEKRKIAAEARRAAVLERIRLQNELEERKKQEALILMAKEQAEAEREIQKQQLLQMAERNSMELEDERSELVEQEFREKEQQAAWHRKEAEQLRKYELEQQQRDEEERRKQSERMQELEEKKRRLQEMQRRSAGTTAKANSEVKKATGEEAAQLARQLRIQNRAKFVTKRFESAPPVADSTPTAVEVTAMPLPQPTPAKDPSPTVDGAFSSALAAASCESELRLLANDLMAEKRSLRQELRAIDAAAADKAGEAVEAGKGSAVDSQLAALEDQEQAVQRRMDALLRRSDPSLLAAQLTGVGTAHVISSLNQPPPPLGECPQEKDLFQQAETLLQEGQALLRWVQSEGQLLVELHLTAETLAEEKASQPQGLQGSGESAWQRQQLRRIAVLPLEIAQLTKALARLLDPIDYKGRLDQLHSQLKQALILTRKPDSAAEQKEVPASCSSHLSAEAAPENGLPTDLPESDSVHPVKSTPDEKEESVEEQLPSSKEEPIDADEEPAVDPESLPGWAECLHTSMASAAHHAAFFGHAAVLSLLAGCFDCFVMDDKGRTPLFYAALQNRLQCVAVLVQLDPNLTWLDVGDLRGDTPLHAAALSNGVEVLQFLLECEAQPDTANHQGLTPCHLARSLRALQVLVRAGAQPFCMDQESRLPLWFACSEGRDDTVDFLCSVTPAAYLLWPDQQGDTCLHVAAINGHSSVVTRLARWVRDLHVLNAKQHTAAHVAKTAAVLKALFESGADLWLRNNDKLRPPLFVAAFFGRVDCVAFLLELALAGGSDSCSKMLGEQDSQGDTALHAACVRGHLQVAGLLLFHGPGSLRNKAKLLPEQLAEHARHFHIAEFVRSVEQKRANGSSTQEIFGCDFQTHSAVMLHYKSRWTKGYDHNYDTFYYLDRATGQTQWDRPVGFDESEADESSYDTACRLLKLFYLNFNPEKFKDINNILATYRNKYTELFISLADKYQVEDLSIFDGISFD